MVQALQDEIVSEVILLNPHQKITEFLSLAPLLMDTVMRQARYALNPVLLLISEETYWVNTAFILTLFLNVCVIFEMRDRYVPGGALTAAAVLHVLVSVLLCVSFALNRLPVDWLRFQPSIPTTSLENPRLNLQQGLSLALATITFWGASSRMLYYVLFLFFSLLGAAASTQFFAFHLFDLCLRIPVMGFVVRFGHCLFSELKFSSAIRQNVLRIGAAILLLFMMVYVYTLIGQATYSGIHHFFSLFLFLV